MVYYQWCGFEGFYFIQVFKVLLVGGILGNIGVWVVYFDLVEVWLNGFVILLGFEIISVCFSIFLCFCELCLVDIFIQFWEGDLYGFVVSQLVFVEVKYSVDCVGSGFGGFLVVGLFIFQQLYFELFYCFFIFSNGSEGFDKYGVGFNWQLILIEVIIVFLVYVYFFVVQGMFVQGFYDFGGLFWYILFLEDYCQYSLFVEVVF